MCDQTSYLYNMKHVPIHRIILERMLNRALADGEEVDHVDGNGLNNCRSNLRLVSRSKNMQNQQKSKRTLTSKYKGVYLRSDGKKWCAQIKINGKTVYLGNFDTEIMAAATYDNEAKKLFGKFAHLNFRKADLKIKVMCSNCKSRWTHPTPYTKCPFCGSRKVKVVRSIDMWYHFNWTEGLSKEDRTK